MHQIQKRVALQLDSSQLYKWIRDSNKPTENNSDKLAQAIETFTNACAGYCLVLNWLRYRSLILGRKVKAEDVLPVADYFGLSELRTLLEKKQETEDEAQGKLITAIEEGVEKLEEVLQHIEGEFTGINDKLEDFKVEVGESYCYHLAQS